MKPRALRFVTPRHLLSQAEFPTQLGQLAWTQADLEHLSHSFELQEEDQSRNGS